MSVYYYARFDVFPNSEWKSGKRSTESETEENKIVNRLDDDENIVSPKEPVMSKEERRRAAIELYTNAVASYNKYLEKTGNAKDKEDIQNQIKSLEEEITKLRNE